MWLVWPLSEHPTLKLASVVISALNLRVYQELRLYVMDEKHIDKGEAPPIRLRGKAGLRSIQVSLGAHLHQMLSFLEPNNS